MAKKAARKARSVKTAKTKSKPRSPRSGEPTPVVEAPPSCCPKCGSTERTDYSNTTRIAYNGLHDGRKYSHVVWRTTSCKKCGQRRRDRSYEMSK